MGKKNRNKPHSLPNGSSPEVTADEDGLETEGGSDDIEGTDETAESVVEASASPVEAEPVPTAPIVAQPTSEAPRGSLVETQSHASLQANDPDAQRLAIFTHQLQEYAEKMGASVPMTEAQGVPNQKALYRTLVQILSLEGSAFYKGWSLFLKTVHAHRQGAFHETRAYRYFDRLKPMEPKEVVAFRHLLHLGLMTADPKGRFQALKLLNLEHLVKTLNLPIPNVGEKLLGYYHP